MGPNHHFLNHDQTRNSLIRQMLFYHKSIAQCGGLRVSHEFHFERRKMPWVVHLAHMHFRSRFFEAAIVQVLRFESAPARPSQTNCSLTRLWGIFPVNEGKVYKSINKYIYIFGRKKHITQLIKLVGAVVFHPRNV
jgi:hypothetical protein